MKTRFLLLLAVVALIPAWRSAVAQVPAKSIDIIQEVHPDGAVDLTFQLAFDALPWAVWKNQVGDDPARLRGLMRYQFAAYVIDDFKFQKDDLNRTAKISMHSPAGPELRKDGRLEIGVEPWLRLINHAGREWFFSGNNPAAGNQQNTVKIVFPVNTVEAALVNAGTPDQALVYGLQAPAGRSRLLLWAGLVVLVLGAAGLVLGLLPRKATATPAG